MRNDRRTRALILCAAFGLMLLVSSALIVHEADHDCAGEDCPICRMIAVNAELLRLAGGVLVMLTAAFWMTRQQGLRRALELRRVSAVRTLISWKIRLND